MASQPEMRARALEHVTSLERGGRYTLCIWPYHSLIGSEGHAVKPALFDALRTWEAQFRIVDYISKGSNVFTEHYSAIRAEVPDPEDPGTQVNQALIDKRSDARTTSRACPRGPRFVGRAGSNLEAMCFT